MTIAFTMLGGGNIPAAIKPYGIKPCFRPIVCALVPFGHGWDLHSDRCFGNLKNHNAGCLGTLNPGYGYLQVDSKEIHPGRVLHCN